MNRFCTTLILVAGLLLAFVPRAAAQQPVDSLAERIRRAYAAVDAAVVRIRTVADIPLEVPDPASGLATVGARPLTTYGTGVVVGSVHTGERWEYLVMTNHHVADVSNYVVPDGRRFRENRSNTLGAPAVPEETVLLLPRTESAAAAEIRLVEVARDVRGDMALLRTVGAERPLVPFTGTIGFRPGEVAPGTRVITSGFPLQGEKIVALGTILDLDHPHPVGLPHHDYTVDIPIHRGQSGSPVFLVEVRETTAEPEIRFHLVGLLHAREEGHRLMVPYPLWKETLLAMPGPLRERLVP